MWNARTRTHLFLIQSVTPLLATSFLYGQAQVSPADPPDLPPVIESSGPEVPPDVPVFLPMGSPPATISKPANTTPARSGGVLDTLDNLPPVGNTSALSPAQRNQPPLSAPGNPGPVPEAPAATRVVRFGDVKSESSVRDQFPERRPTETGPRRNVASNAPEFRPESTPANRPRNLLDRLMPWRKPPAEPPLLRDKMGLDKEETDEPSTQNSRGRNPVELADRVDSEIQKRVDRIARQQVGSRANELDVEVINREVYIRARPTWFWQRMQVSEDLQKLPGVDASRLHITVY